LIKNIALKGFQSHELSEIDLVPGLNVITGPSDSGKTAVIRAIRWLAFNEPQGEAFVNDRVGEAEVQVTLQSGAIITKTRRKGKTSYLVQQDETDSGSLFEKSEVPLEVTRLLGIEKQTFGDFVAALNFSFQLDAPFLISETASAGAKILGKLAGTESVDLAIKGVSKDTYAARNERSQAEKDAERITGSLLEFLGIDDHKQSLETAELLMEQIESSNTKFETLKEHRVHYVLAIEKVNELFETLNKLAHVPDLEIDMQDIEKSQQRYDDLLQMYSDGNRLQEKINVLGQELETYTGTKSASDLLNSIVLDTDRLTNNITLRQVYHENAEDVRRANLTLEKTKELDSAARGLNDTENMLNTITDLRNTQDEYESTSNRLNTLNTRLDTFKDIHDLEVNLKVAESGEKRFTVLKELQNEYRIASQLLNNATFTNNNAYEDFHTAENELQQAWDETGGVCPLCEQAHGQEVCD